MLVLDPKSKMPLYAQLYQQIREDISNGSIKVGTRLPSSRKLATDLRISRNTVELAYEQLSSEGFIKSRPRQGYYSELPPFEAPDKRAPSEAISPEADDSPEGNIIYDFQNKKVHSEDFPFDRWKKLVNRCFQEYKNGFLQYGCPFGEPGLRSEIQRHIYNYRQVECKAKQIIIGPGTQFCLELVCQLLKPSGTNAAMEDPGYAPTRTTFQNNGFKIYPVELDANGINVNLLNAVDAHAVYVTPSHQYPTGIIMPMDRRLELVEWAKRKKTVIIEDDYNYSFQYDQKPLPSIHSLCSDRVIYMGSFSDILFPAIGVSYAVLPEHLLDRLCKRYCSDTTFVPFLTQKALELFFREGLLEKHVRKTIQQQRKKRNMLVSALKNELGNHIRIIGEHAGLHLLVQATWEITGEELINLAKQAGVSVQPTSDFRSWPQAEENGTVLLNYGGMKPEHIPIAVGLLREAWLTGRTGAIKKIKTGSCNSC